MFLGTIQLQTNDEAQSLRFEGIEEFADGSGYVCNLVVRSRGFCCERKFYFDKRFLNSFIDGIEAMDRGAAGQALLKGTWETDQVLFEMYPNGHVIIQGDITEYSALTQHLRFALQTDQTVLRPFILELRALAQGKLHRD